MRHVKKSEPAQRQCRPSAGPSAAIDCSVHVSRAVLGRRLRVQTALAGGTAGARCNGRQARSAAPRRMQHATLRLATRQMQRPECSTDTQREPCNAQHAPFQRAPSDETRILYSARAQVRVNLHRFGPSACRKVLSREPGILCFSDEHTQIMLVGGAGLVVYAGGCAPALCRARTFHRSAPPALQRATCNVQQTTVQRAAAKPRSTAHARSMHHTQCNNPT